MTPAESTILIGGAPCAGKSTVAAALATELGCTWTSTDDLRDRLQKSGSAQAHHYPWIFSNAAVNAEEYWRTHTPQDVIHLEIEQARELWPSVQRAITQKTHGILEGVSLLPQLIAQEFGDKIRTCFLVDTNRERVRKTIWQRGLWGEANTYAGWIKPLELEWVMLHNEWVATNAKKYSLPLVEAGDRTTVLARTRQALGL